MEEKLKPCPFCGSDEAPRVQVLKGRDGFRNRYAVVCNYWEGGCGAEGGVYHSEVEAVDAWNRRSNEKTSNA